MRWILVAIVLASCHPGGEYVQTDRQGGKVDRGEVNGRVFDFVDNKPEGDDWTVRIRGTSMFVSYANADSTDKLGSDGSINLTEKEGRKVWKLVDLVDMPSRKHGKKWDDGYVTMVLHTPAAPDAEDAQTTLTTVNVHRDNDIDDDVTNLAAYLVDLVKKYKGEAPKF